VRLGLVLLGLVLTCCLLGTLIVQQEASGFAEYYAALTPAQKTIYGKLGLFDVYGSWYFAALLVVTGLNIVVSSLDRFPGAWRYVRRPKVEASKHYLRAQAVHDEAEVEVTPETAARRVAAAWRAKGLKPRVTERAGRVSVFAERNAWNRLGAYVVHVALLAIFAGGFITSRFAVSGVIAVEPGSSTDTFVTFDQKLDKQQARELRLPFRVECTDIEQQLVDPAGDLAPSNTLDWLSRVRISDGDRSSEALIHLNEPLDYRGYRFFQSSFEPEGSARAVTLRIASASTGETREVTVRRNQAVDVDGVGRIEYVAFYPDFTLAGGRPATRSGEYNNPVAGLQVTTPGGATRQIFALGPDLASAIGASGHASAFQLAGDTSVVLESFEKVARSHMLRVQYDPGKNLVYTGCAMLVISLALIFAFAHERYWASIEPAASGARITFGANSNRNPTALGGRFAALVEEFKGSGSES
jgi:cytochrome c biogenesis protein